MLSRADVELIGRDRALPALAVLLDPQALAAELRAALPGRELGAVEITYLRYKPHTNCLAAFTVEVGAGRVQAYAKAYAPASRDGLEKFSERERVPGPLGDGRLLIHGDTVEVAVFPNDNKLSSLGRLFADHERTRLLECVAGTHKWLRDAAFEGLRYKPERRYVARLTGTGGSQALLKLYSKREYARASVAARATRALDGIRVTSPIGFSDRHQAMAFEWLPGRCAHEVIHGGDGRPEDVERIGATLARFHALDGGGLAARDAGAVGQAAFASAEALGFLLPVAEALSSGLAEHLSRELERTGGTIGPVHGDFYARQVLLDGSDVAILDLDEAVLADTAEDLGLFIAHLEQDAIRGDTRAARVPGIREALLRGYGTVARVPDNVELHTALGLLQLAPHYFRNRDPLWPVLTVATLERAAELAGYRPAAAGFAR